MRQKGEGTVEGGEEAGEQAQDKKDHHVQGEVVTAGGYEAEEKKK